MRLLRFKKSDSGNHPGPAPYQSDISGDASGDGSRAGVNFELVTAKGPVPYLILSHTWDPDPDNEFLFADVQNGTGRSKPGFQKVESFLRLAVEKGSQCEHAWVDTCCIGKSSSAELSEAINSMFQWYADAEVCVVYLADLPGACSRLPDGQLTDQLAKCRWFRRGWTLQELLAPKRVLFYSADWNYVGDRDALRGAVSHITGIDANALDGNIRWMRRHYSIAQRMSWASNRETTRPEDLAYCLLGIFNVNMPLLYGEGDKAFHRLQEEIIKASNDQTIFCWEKPEEDPRLWTDRRFLARSPRFFRNSSNIVPIESRQINSYQLTNAGLRMRAAVISDGSYHGMLVLRGRNSGSRLVLMVEICEDHARSGQYFRSGHVLVGGVVPHEAPEQDIYLVDRHPMENFVNGTKVEGNKVSIRLASPCYRLPGFQIKEIYPRGRWNSRTGVFSPPDFDSKYESLDGYSWHAVMKFSLRLPGLSEDTSLIAVCGYDGVLMDPWCALSASSQDNLQVLWRTAGRNLVCEQDCTMQVTPRVLLRGSISLIEEMNHNRSPIQISADHSRRQSFELKLELELCS